MTITNKIDVSKLSPMALTCAATIEAFAPDAATGTKAVPKISMNAYNGGKMNPMGFSGTPVVIDLAGMSIPSNSIPIRLEHSRDQGVGHLNSFTNDGKTLMCSGLISRDTVYAADVVNSAKNGFPWQASVGCSINEIVYVPETGSAKINGQTFAGPLYIAAKTTLMEVSLTELGADPTTSATIAANAAKEAVLRIHRDPAAPVTGTEPNAGNQPNTPAPVIVQANAAPVKTAEQINAEAVAEQNRITEINALECSLPNASEIRAAAIKNKSTPGEFALTVLRASRPAAPNAIIIETPKIESSLLECSMAQRVKMPDIEKVYKPETLEASHRAFKTGLGIQHLMLQAAWANGYKKAQFGGNELEIQRAAFGYGIQASSNIDIGGILSNIANKFLLAGFNFTEQAWRQISQIATVPDFKTMTSYRLTGAGTYQRVAPGGTIKNGTLGNQSYTNAAQTYGLMLNIDRTMIINDDLNALGTIPRKLGAGAGNALNEVFWTAFLDDSSFFSSGNSNYLVGAVDSLLTVNGITNLLNKFNQLIDTDGQIIGHTARILLVPTALQTAATQLMRSTEIRDTTASTLYGTANPHAGLFTPVASRYLQRTTIGGATVTGSSTAWYLLADPMDVPVIQTVFLNGQENPTVESAVAEFNTLGIQMRGVHDFGVAKQDARGGCKAKGAA
jgi:hypothetical protein